jgi:RluA family pseudouridine synthase
VFDVLYLDNHLLVVHKPAGLLSQADRTGDPDLVTEAKAFLKEEFDKPGNVFVGLVHRLDRPVSGVMVLARTSKAASRLSDQFRKREPDKTYLAAVEGQLVGSGEQEDYLLKDGRRGVVSRVKAGTKGAKRARLRWKALQVVGKKTLVEVELLTGRAHQIRVQLAGMGHPILGDRKYGSREPFSPPGLAPGARAIALHAGRLAFEHPVRREPVAFDAPPAWPFFDLQ